MKNFYLSLEEIHNTLGSYERRDFDYTIRKLTRGEYKKVTYKHRFSCLFLIEKNLLNLAGCVSLLQNQFRLRIYTTQYLLNCVPNLYSLCKVQLVKDFMNLLSTPENNNRELREEIERNLPSSEIIDTNEFYFIKSYLHYLKTLDIDYFSVCLDRLMDILYTVYKYHDKVNLIMKNAFVNIIMEDEYK